MPEHRGDVVAHDAERRRAVLPAVDCSATTTPSCTYIRPGTAAVVPANAPSRATPHAPARAVGVADLDVVAGQRNQRVEVLLVERVMPGEDGRDLRSGHGREGTPLRTACAPASRPRPRCRRTPRHRPRRRCACARSPATDPSRAHAAPHRPCRGRATSDTPSSSLTIVHSPVGPSPSSVACRCSVVPAVHRRRLALGLDGHQFDPLADRRRRPARAAGRNPAPSASAASARCTTTSCTRRRIHQPAGRGPMKVHTRASAPTRSTASMISCGAVVQPVDGGVGIVRRLAVAHVARVERLGAAVGDDLCGPTVSAPDVAEQLVAASSRDRSAPGLTGLRCGSVPRRPGSGRAAPLGNPRHERTAVRAFPSAIGREDQPRSTRVSRRLPSPASRASG